MFMLKKKKNNLKIIRWLYVSSCHWDLEKGVKTMDFNGHAGDIAGLSLSPDMNTYITGSVDKTAKLWDVREETHKQMFFGHEMDVNSVCVSIFGRIRNNINILK